MDKEATEQPLTETTEASESAPTPVGPVAPAKVTIEADEPLTGGVLTGEAAEREMRRHTRRSFLWAGAALLGVPAGWKWFNDHAPEDGTSIKQVFRRTLQFNETVARTVFFSPTHRAREFPREKAVEPRNNYKGETPEIDLDSWRLHLSGTAEGDRVLTMGDLETLPRSEQTTELKCVEGWSAVVNWSGIPLVEFLKKYPVPVGVEYVSMRSEPEGYEDEWYYVGLDMPGCLHPQSLLATHMNGEPLTAAHGAPLRLVMPHKYGIKQIKLITHIAYEKERSRDYWAEQGYDWYAGL
ncbi:MAG: molybdopterin-dependent oxidoreductase [Capsulimonadales bacterium]|nr:molybdopterin-dependent oxidoreductase [Capsulimonadales bacterium]